MQFLFDIYDPNRKLGLLSVTIEKTVEKPFNKDKKLSFAFRGSKFEQLM